MRVWFAQLIHDYGVTLELIVFDLDGTLLNGHSQISPYTRDTLKLLAARGVAYTVATGRTLHASREILAGHSFDLPHIYKNGVMIWSPGVDRYSHTNFLTQGEIQQILEAVLAQQVSPFIFTVEEGGLHAIYHGALHNDDEKSLARAFANREGVSVRPVSELPGHVDISNISALGAPQSIDAIASLVDAEPGLVAYSGQAVEGRALKWLDIHHGEASKGGAVSILKQQLGMETVLCFGDSDNDLSMFALADESYAPENALAEVKAAASAVIGHHGEDGIAHFLRQRFDLPPN